MKQLFPGKYFLKKYKQCFTWNIKIEINKKRMKLRFIAISLWEMFFLCQFVIMLL